MHWLHSSEQEVLLLSGGSWAARARCWPERSLHMGTSQEAVAAALPLRAATQMAPRLSGRRWPPPSRWGTVFLHPATQAASSLSSSRSWPALQVGHCQLLHSD